MGERLSLRPATRAMSTETRAAPACAKTLWGYYGTSAWLSSQKGAARHQYAGRARKRVYGLFATGVEGELSNKNLLLGSSFFLKTILPRHRKASILTL